jgi:hypothetical protein
MGSVIKHALDDYGYHGADMGHSFSSATSRIFPLILSQLLIVLLNPLVGYTTGSLLLTNMMTYSISIIYTQLDIYFSMIGIILLIGIVHLYLAVRLSPTVAILMAEDISLLDAMKRAFSLTTHDIWHILGGWIVIGIITTSVSGITNILLIPLLLLGAISGFTSTLYTIYFSMIILSICISAIIGPIQFILQVVLFRDLQAREAMQTKDDWW